VEIAGLALGLVLVVVGLWLARTFRKADPNRPQKPDTEV
jgi:type IV secretory pathway TrbD component